MQTSLFPDRFRILSGSGLKTIAMVAMLIDHTAHSFQKLLKQYLFTMFNIRFTPYILLRGVGRIAFPIFCFLLAEGFRHTRSKPRYALNLLIFAMLSEIPFNIVHDGVLAYPNQNVFFTLLLGFLGMWVISRIREVPRSACLGLAGLGVLALLLQPGIPIYGPVALIALGLFAALIHESAPLRGALILIGLGIIALLLKCDYDWKGYLLILLTYLLGEHPMVQCLSGVTLLSWPGGVACAYPLMNLYNGKRGYIHGPVLKYAFYLFYPVHLTIIWLVHLKTLGY